MDLDDRIDNIIDGLIIESFEMLAIRPKEFFNKEIHLFHFSKEKQDVIKPTSLQLGTSLSKPRASSFWFKNYWDAVTYGLYFTPFNKIINKAIPEHGLPKYNEIDKEKYKYLYKLAQYKGDKIANKTVSELTWVECPNDIIKYLIYVKDDSEKKEIIAYIKSIKVDFYINELIINGSDPDLGIGHNIKHYEFTIDREVKPDKITHITRLDDDFIEKNIIFTNDKEYFLEAKDKWQKYQFTATSKKEKMVKPYWNTRNTKLYTREMHKAKESTQFFRKKISNAINNNYHNVIISADAHLCKNMENKEDIASDIKKYLTSIKELCDKKIAGGKTNDVIILLLGDIIDKTCTNFDYAIWQLGKAMLEIDAVYLIGNSEYKYDIKHIELASRAVFKVVDYLFETDKYVFSHAPVELPEGSSKINIHGHLHGHNTYWINPTSHINVWNFAPNGKPILLDDLIRESRKSNVIKTKSNHSPSIKEMKHDDRMKPMSVLYKNYQLHEEKIDTVIDRVIKRETNIQNKKK